MNDQEAIAFVNEHIRPLCERVRDLKYLIALAAVDWATVESNFVDANADVEDGRDAEAVSRLTCGDVTAAWAELEAIELDDAVIGLPCVRAFDEEMF